MSLDFVVLAPVCIYFGIYVVSIFLLGCCVVKCFVLFVALANLIATYSRTSLIRTSVIQTLQLTEHPNYNSSTCRH